MSDGLNIIMQFVRSAQVVVSLFSGVEFSGWVWYNYAFDDLRGVIMNKTYTIGYCPICNTYGKMELLFDKTINKIIAMCDECDLEFSCISDYQSNTNGHRIYFDDESHPELPITRSATLNEIKNTEWYPFIKIN